MKTLINRFAAAVLMLAVSSICARSQTRTVEHSLSPFDGIEASDGFKVSISMSEMYSVKLTVDDILESYVECYVKAGVLYIGLDQKSVPKDLKKIYKGRNSADPTLVAVVSLPALKSLTLNDNSQFFSSVTNSSGEFAMNLTGSSAVNNIKLAGKAFDIKVGKNAKFTNSVVTAEEDVKVACDSKGSVAVECDARNITMTGGGAGIIDIKGNVEDKVKLSIAGSSNVILAGSCASLAVDGKGTSAKVDASQLAVKDVTLSVTSVSVDVKPSDNLELDLGRGADVTYAGNPAINLIKIQNASVIRK